MWWRKDQAVTKDLQVDKSFGECLHPSLQQQRPLHCWAKESELANTPHSLSPSLPRSLSGYGGIWAPSDNGPPGRIHHVNFLHLSSSLKGLFTGNLPRKVFCAHLEMVHNGPLKRPEAFREVRPPGLRFKEQKPTFIFLSRLLWQNSSQWFVGICKTTLIFSSLHRGLNS